MRSMDSVFKEIDFLVKKYDIRKLFLSDELFAVYPDRIIDFCERIKNYHLQWILFLRISDSLTLEILQMMKDSGCEWIFFGIESADDRILKSMNKRITISMIERTLLFTKKAGISTRANFIFGDPEETEETVNNTISWVNAHRDILDVVVSFVPIILYPGSVLFNNAVKSGKINPLDHIRNQCPHVNVSHLSDEYFAYLINDVFPVTDAKNNFALDNKILFSVGKNDKEYEVSLSCPNCQNKSFITINCAELSKEQAYYMVYKFQCTNCDYSTRVDLISCYISWVDEKLKKLIKNYNCAIWPVSAHFAKVYECSEVFKDSCNEYVLINRGLTNSRKQFIGKPIHSPDEILQGGGGGYCNSVFTLL